MTKLVNLLYDVTSEESRYMLRIAEEHNIAKRAGGMALVLGFLVWALYNADLANNREFARLKGKVWYHYYVGRVVRCVQRVWRKVMLLLLPRNTIYT